MERGLLADAAVSQSVAQTQAFWAVRDICAEFGQVLGPHISYDIGLAVARMDEFVTPLQGRARRPAFPDARASITAISATAICTWCPGSRACRSSVSRRRRWTRSSTAWCATWVAASPPSTASAR